MAYEIADIRDLEEASDVLEHILFAQRSEFVL